MFRGQAEGLLMAEDRRRCHMYSKFNVKFASVMLGLYDRADACVFLYIYAIFSCLAENKHMRIYIV